MANFFDQFDEAATPQQPDYGKAISSIESGGNYRAVGPKTRTGDRAVGKYQVMGQNVGPWTEEILGQRMDPMQFLASPDAQEAVFKGKFGSYVEKYGPEGAAKAWFAGEGGMNDPNRKDVLGTSVADYARKFTGSIGSQPAMAFAGEDRPQPKEQSQNFFDQFDGQKSESGASGVDEAGFNKPDIGRGRAFLTGAEQGLTANFGDELRGVKAASGLPKWAGAIANAVPGGQLTEPLVGLAKLGYEYLNGGDEAAKRYASARDEFRELSKTAQQQYPGTTMAGNVAGAIAMPGGAMMNAATLPARMVRGAAMGAAYGGASGVGEGETLQQRAIGGAAGAGTGLALGAAGVPVVEGVIQAGRALTRPIANSVRGIINPEGEAARRVGLALEGDIKVDPNAVSRLTGQEFGASASSGGPARVMDLGGEKTRALARSAANTSPEGRGVLSRTIDERFEEQAPRLAGWLRATFHYPDANAQQQAIDVAARSVNQARYGQAIRDGRVGVWDQELAELSQAPIMQDAVKAATRQAQNRSAPDVGQGAAINQRWVGQNGPTIEFWDLVKRQLDQEINVARRAGRNEDVMEATRVKSALVGKLDTAVPSYAAARSGAAHFFGAQDALEAGQNFVGASAKYGINDARKALSHMSPQERQLFQDGYVSRLVETIEKTGDRRNILNQIGSTPAARKEIEVALGAQRANELEAVLRVEGIMDLARGAVQGNSTTARQLVELGLAGGVGGIGYMSSDPQAAVNAALVWGAARGQRAIDARVAQRVAHMLTSSDPKVLSQGVQMVARSKALMDQFRRVDVALARVSAQQSPRPAIQLPATGRAEDQQQ